MARVSKTRLVDMARHIVEREAQISRARGAKIITLTVIQKNSSPRLILRVP